MPLIRGGYPATDPVWSALGRPANATTPNVAARSNARYLGLVALTDEAAALATGVTTSVPIAVEVGDVITTVSVLAGATAESGGSHAFAVLYSGIATPAKIVQSADVTGAAAIAASARFDFTLATATVITPALAPNGFIYAGICVTGTPPSLVSVTNAAAGGYQWFTTSPLKGINALAHGSAQLGTAAATIASPTAQAKTPLVFLT